MKNKKELPERQRSELLEVLATRFGENMDRHRGLDWNKIKPKLQAGAGKLWSLHEMESTGGEPDVTGYDEKAGCFVFCDCSTESPKGRRSLCYDAAALASRKKFKPEDNAAGMAAAMGIELLTVEQYRSLQEIGPFDSKTSSWLKTPPGIRQLGGALFGDFRYGTVFVYHNGADSYYAARGFRGMLLV